VPRPLTRIEVGPVAILPPSVPRTPDPCPCPCDTPSVDCAVCWWCNPPGHERQQHRDFVTVITPNGGADRVCTLCVATALFALAESGLVSVVLSVPLTAVPW